MLNESNVVVAPPIIPTRQVRHHLAHFVSNLINPLFVTSYMVYVLVAHLTPNTAAIWGWTASAVLLVSVPPTAYIVWLVKQGELADVHMPDRSSRLKPLLVLVVWMAICLTALNVAGIPHTLNVLLWVILGKLILLGGFTLFWMISFHGTAIAAAAGISWIVGSLLGGLMLLALVVWARRVYLKRHSMAQVLAGCTLGASVAIATLFVFWPWVF